MLTRSHEWLTKQLITLGSSAAGVVANESPYQSPVDLYTAMVAAAEGRITAKDMNDDMKRGIVTEPLHRDLLASEIGKRVHDHNQDDFIYNDQYPWAHALPDGWVLYNSEEPPAHGNIPVQLKCPRVRGWQEIKLKGIHGHWLLGSQHTLAVTGAPYEIFSVLNPESMRLIYFPVYRDEKLILSLMDMEKKFYATFMERTPPFSLEQERIELPPLTGELTVIDSLEATHAAEAFMDAKALLDDAKALYETAVSKIKELMGEARVVDLPGLRAYQSNQLGRVTYDYKAMQKDGIVLDKYAKRGDDYVQFRTFRRG